MTESSLSLIPSSAGVTEKSIRASIRAQAAALTPPTMKRYAITADALFEFLDTVDVETRLGRELAQHLASARARLGSGAFLPTLGVVSMIRICPTSSTTRGFHRRALSDDRTAS